MKPIIHYRQLTFRYLLNQRKRSILTVIGIMLSVALVFGASIMGETLKGEMLQSVKNRHGDYHIAYLNVSDKQMNQLKNYAQVEQLGRRIVAGHSQEADGLSLMVVGADQGYYDMFGLSLESGRMPEAQGEIALEQWYLEQVLDHPKLGDRIVLELGMIPAEPTDMPSTQSAAFILTGILNNKSETQLSGKAHGTTSLETAAALWQEQAQQDAIIRFDKHVNIRNATDDMTQAIAASPEQTASNTALLTVLGESANKSKNDAIATIQYIVIGIILIATVAVIYNAFHISVLERTKQFGVLRSLGMTPRQIRVIVFSEATILATIAIPFGLFFGWLAIKIVLAVFAMIGGQNELAQLTMILPWKYIVLSVILGFIAVYLSAFGPAWSAGRVSPLTAIMHSNRFNKEKMVRRKSPIIRWLFGITGKMAIDHLKRNRGRFRITLFSMSIGIALFLFFYSLMNYIQLAQSGTFSKDFAVEQSLSEVVPKLTPDNYEAVVQMSGVRKVHRVMWNTMYTKLPVEKLTTAFKNKIGQLGDTFGFPVELRGYKPDDLDLSRDWLIEGRMNADEMNKEMGVVISQNSRFTGDTIQVTNLKVGDIIPLSISPNEGNKTEQVIEVKVLGIMDKMPLNYNGGAEQFTLITTEEVYSKLTGYAEAYNRFDIVIKGDADRVDIKEQLEQMARQVKDVRVMDFSNSEDRNSILMIAILLYGLVTVISIISAINIINTISTNLILRTSEFGTLRAIGMTMRQMRRMIMYESVLYGLYALVFGGAAGTILAYFLYAKMDSIQEIPYHFPWSAVLGSGCVAIIISLLASIIPLRRIEKMDVVRAIRVEE